MSRFLIDANVLLDIATADKVWLRRSEAQLRAATEAGVVYINPIIYAEVAAESFAVANMACRNCPLRT